MTSTLAGPLRRPVSIVTAQPQFDTFTPAHEDQPARSTGAETWRLVSKVLLPGALPGFLVGLRFALAFSILGLVAAETVNATAGLGFMITRAQTFLRTDVVFVGLAIYSIFGLLADRFVRLLERVWLSWRPSFEAA